MRPRLLMLTQWFDPEGSSFKGLAFAKGLQHAGFDVQVLTGFPNYPGGKVFPGYRIKPFQREVMDGIIVNRVPLYPSHSQSKFGRIANYLSFALSATIYGCLFARRADMMYVYHPPLTVGVAATIIRASRGFPVLYDVQDLWPDTLAATGMVTSPRALGIVGKVCEWVYRRADRIAVLSPGFKRLLVERGVPESKIEVIYNWAPEAVDANVNEGGASPLGDPTRFHVLFAGNLGAAQALDSVVAAAAILQTSAPRIMISLLGDGVEVARIRAEIERRALYNLRILGRVPPQVAAQYQRAADALLVHLRNDPLFNITIPSKTQGYLAAGRPIIMAVSGDAADLIRRSQAGVVVPPESPAELAAAIWSLSELPSQELARLGANGRSYYEQHLSAKIGMAQFALALRRTMRI
jgi:colanic acid biosynthesis glycosyl transferase WcaI